VERPVTALVEPFVAGPLDRDAVVYVAGHAGLVGSAIWRKLTAEGFTRLVGARSSEVDLTDRVATHRFFERHRPRYVFDAAARVGGIYANSSRPVEFLSENLQIQVNIMDAALAGDVVRLLFLGSSCIYPKYAVQPIREEALLTGALEPTNSAYAVAKIAGIAHVQAVRKQYGRPWISAMPTNLYGPGDNFSLSGSHVLPAMIRRYDEGVRSGATCVTNWGTGDVRREFLHVDDLASACLHMLENYDGDLHVNVGTGSDLTLKDLSNVIARTVGYEGEVQWDTSKPDGTPRKLLDVSVLESLGWRPTIALEDGIATTLQWYRTHGAEIRNLALESTNRGAPFREG
jgi:GDP-L-fucose synthase